MEALPFILFIPSQRTLGGISDPILCIYSKSATIEESNEPCLFIIYN